MKIGVGLIGYGLGGRVFHAPFVKATPGLDLRAVVSRDAGKVRADLPDVAVAPDVATLLERPDIDLVVVSSPDALHAEHAIAAIASGRHVVVDKPFATNLTDARAMIAAADCAGVQLTAFQNRRWDADFLTLRRLIDEGALGQIVQLESRFDRWRREPAKVWKEAREGGVWLDLGPHLVDQALCLLGKPMAVTADLAALRRGAPAPDWFHVTLHYSAARAVLQASKLTANNDLRFVVHGTGGSWIKHGFDRQEPSLIAGSGPNAPDFGIDPKPGIYTPADSTEVRQQVANARGHYLGFWQALVESLTDQDRNPVPPGDALLVMEVLDAGLRSAREDRTIRL